MTWLKITNETLVDYALCTELGTGVFTYGKLRRKMSFTGWVCIPDCGPAVYDVTHYIDPKDINV